MVAPHGSSGGPAQPSPTIGQCLNGGLGWLEVECNRCKTRASLQLNAIRRPRDTPIWKLEASPKSLEASPKSKVPIVPERALRAARPHDLQGLVERVAWAREIAGRNPRLANGSFQNLILERHALGVVFLKPGFGRDLGRKYLRVIAVANLLAGVDVNPDRHWCLLSFLRPPEIGHGGLTF
jgi:hypothetical protein